MADTPSAGLLKYAPRNAPEIRRITSDRSSWRVSAYAKMDSVFTYMLAYDSPYLDDQTRKGIASGLKQCRKIARPFFLVDVLENLLVILLLGISMDGSTQNRENEQPENFS